MLTAIAEPKRQKLPLWPEWSESDVNAEKWDSAGFAAKPKEAKGAKPASAPVSHGFEDPEPRAEWPWAIGARVESFRRPSELFERTPVVVDESQMDAFDLVSPNEHLHTNETFR